MKALLTALLVVLAFSLGGAALGGAAFAYEIDIGPPAAFVEGTAESHAPIGPAPTLDNICYALVEEMEAKYKVSFAPTGCPNTGPQSPCEASVHFQNLYIIGTATFVGYGGAFEIGIHAMPRRLMTAKRLLDEIEEVSTLAKKAILKIPY